MTRSLGLTPISGGPVSLHHCFESQLSHLSNRYRDVGFQVLTAVAMNVDIYWDTAPRSLCVNRRFRGTYHFHLQVQGSDEQKTVVYHVASLPEIFSRDKTAET
jgi:hypothetical protein